MYRLPQENSCSANWKCPVLVIHRPIMPKATKSSAWGNSKVPPHEKMVQSSQEELSSSDQEPDQEVSFHHHR